MTEKIKSLWPAKIRPKVQSPMTILKAQGDALTELTGGILHTDLSVKTLQSKGSKEKEIISFDIVAPLLNNYRQRILTIAFTKGLPYPAIVEAEGLSDSRNILRLFLEGGLAGLGKLTNQADSDEELIKILTFVFDSTHVVSTINSLIARVTEIQAAQKYVLKKSSNGQFFFNLRAENGEVLLTSEMYKAKNSAEHGIQSVRKNAPNNSRYERLKSTDDHLYFILKAANGEILGRSEMYSSLSDMEKVIEIIKKIAPDAEIESL